MLPLDPTGAVFIFTHFITAGLQIDNPFFPLPVNFTAAVEIAGDIGIDLNPGGFRLGETVDSFGRDLAATGGSQKRRGKNINTGHRELRVKTSPQRSECDCQMQSVRSENFQL